MDVTDGTSGFAATMGIRRLSATSATTSRTGEGEELVSDANDCREIGHGLSRGKLGAQKRNVVSNKNFWQIMDWYVPTGVS